MVDQGLIVGHIVSSKRIEVDKAKIDVIKTLPYPSCVREIYYFLVMQVSIGDSSRISQRFHSRFAIYCRKI